MRPYPKELRIRVVAAVEQGDRTIGEVAEVFRVGRTFVKKMLRLQRAFADTSHARSFEIYMERLKADIWTLEMKERNYADLELFKRYKGQHWPKKVALGVISYRHLQVETPEEVAADIRHALQFIDPEQLVLSTDCGFGRQG